MSNGNPLRRRSIFSGVLLILLGVFLLWHNFRGGFSVWQLFERWWPLLFILWGLAKLYDHLVARRSGEAAPRAITGADIFLVILVVALVGSIGLVERIPWDGPRHVWGLPWEQPYSFSEELPARAVKAGSPISISTDFGDIIVHSEDTAEIRVVVKKTAKAGDEGEARRMADQVSVVITEAGGAHQVSTQNQGGRVQVDLEVHVPQQATITARTSRGGVQVNGVSGNVTVEAMRGNIEVRDCGGDVSAQIERGDIHVADAQGNVKVSGRGGQIEIADVKGEAAVDGEFYGPVIMEKVGKGARFVSRRTDLTISQLSGRFEASSGKLAISDAPGTVSLVTRKNDIELENVAGRIHIENKDGNIELRFAQPPREEVSVANESGSIKLVLRAKSTFEVHAEARQGDVDCEFSDQLAKEQVQERGNTRLDGKVGPKGPQIKLKTTYGSIRLKKGE